MINFAKHPSGFTVLTITNASATATISMYGAQVLSYSPLGRDNLLFVSSKSNYGEGKAIRGGIPVCWPWFGPHRTDARLPQHGFVRTRIWDLEKIEETPDESRVTMLCRSSKETRLLWQHDFALSLTVSVGKALTLELTTANTGEEAFTITDALHTYFSVKDIGSAQVLGLDGVSYADRVEKREETQREIVTVSGEVDRVYRSPSDCAVVDKALGSKVTMKKNGFPDTVVWNPWIDRAKAMADFDDGEYKKMICAEAAAVGKNEMLVIPGASITQGMTLSSEKI